MTTFKNQSIGSYDQKDERQHDAAQWVEVWYDEKAVRAFKFHSIGARSVSGHYHRVHGVTIDAGHIWAAITAFSNTDVMAVHPSGHEYFVVWVSDDKGNAELRTSTKW